MADNFLYIPFINPVKFYDESQENLDKYFTKHFDDYEFEDRLLPWQQNEEYEKIWQTDDIINLQFESTFDPISVQLLDNESNIIDTFPALIGLPNKYDPTLYSFEVSISLADLETGCYRLRIIAGSEGPTQRFFRSGCQYVSSTPIENSICIEYWNSRFHEDVMFESGIKFQYRVYGHFGLLDPARKDELYRDQKYNPALLNSRTSRQFPVYYGNERGLTDDEIDLLNRIWSCDNVLLDNKPFGIADNSKFEFIDAGSEDYPKRGLKLVVEEGINRNSKIFAVETDTTKKLVTSIMVDAKVFGDTSNQGSSNTVPVLNIE